ncbi:hypothetical protein RNC47_35880, partial [Streptomyces sp. DSM 44918]|nr:hypothetical protein [Streptomyces sp. DSM 44918]
MTDQFDCLICGRPALANGEPGCDCVTHSLSRPVHPPDWEPDPADVARFPLEPTPAPSTRVRSVLPATPTPTPTSDPAPADAFPHHLPDQVGPRRS